jgi:hypothetical protein
MKQIYITEKQAKHILSLEDERDDGNKKLIIEMALSLKDYSDMLFNLRNQIIENWCLCRYCQLYDNGNINYNHWLIELRASIQNIKFIKLKSKVSKRKAIIKELIDNCDLDDENIIYLTIQDKFDDEGIYDNEIKYQVTYDFSINIEALIDVLSDDEYTFNSYKKDMFGVE